MTDIRSILFGTIHCIVSWRQKLCNLCALILKLEPSGWSVELKPKSGWVRIQPAILFLSNEPIVLWSSAGSVGSAFIRKNPSLLILMLDYVRAFHREDQILYVLTRIWIQFLVTFFFGLTLDLNAIFSFLSQPLYRVDRTVVTYINQKLWLCIYCLDINNWCFLCPWNRAGDALDHSTIILFIPFRRFLWIRRPAERTKNTNRKFNRTVWRILRIKNPKPKEQEKSYIR